MSFGTNRGLRRKSRHVGILAVATLCTALLAENAFAQQPDTAGTHLMRGNEFNEHFDQADAISEYTKAIDIDPNFLPAYDSRGQIYFQQGKLDQAIFDYSKVIEIRPDMGRGYFLRGQAYLKKQEYDLAIKDATSSLMLQPGVPVCYFIRADGYLHQGKNDLAIADFSEGPKSQPENVDALDYRGFLYQRVGMVDEAIADYTASLNLKPEQPYMNEERAGCYWKKGNYDLALADYGNAAKQLQQLAPHDFTASADIGWCQYRLGRYMESAQYGRMALTLNPNRVPVQFNLALALAASGDWENAQKEYQAGLTKATPSEQAIAVKDIQNSLETSAIAGRTKQPDVLTLQKALALLQSASDNNPVQKK